MDLNDIHERILFELNKAQGQYLTHEEIDLILDRAQMQEFSLLIGNDREANGRIGFGKTQGISEDLLPFYGNTNLANSDGRQLSTSYNASARTYDLPANVQYITSIRKGASEVDILHPAEITARMGSEIIAPTSDYPVAMLYQQSDTVKKIQIFPESADGITVYYLRRPDKPTFVFTNSGRQVLYDEDESTQLEWNDTAIERIIQRAIALAGVNLAASDVTQYNEQKQQTGR